MTQQQIPNQWQLDDTGKTQDRWTLQENDQVLPPHLQLQPETGAGAATWQPIDYRTPKPRPQRGGWIVGVLVILALISVGAYLTWFYVNQFNVGAAQPLPGAVTPDAPVAGGGEPAVVVDATPTQEPTPTLVQEPTATSTPEPTATPTPQPVEMREGVVNSTYGVNMRRDPTADGELIRLLDNNTQVLIIGGPTTDADGAEWWQAAVEPGVQGWVVGEFMTITPRQVPLDEWVARLRAMGIEPTPTPEPVIPAAAITTTEALTVSANISGSLQGGGLTDDIGVTAIISAAAGLNAREQPADGAPVVTLLANNASLAVAAVSDDGQWLQVRLPDGGLGWVSRTFVNVIGDLAGLQAGGGITAGLPVTPTTSLTATAPLTTSVTPTATTPLTSTGTTTGTATVTFVTGVNARPAPSTTAAGVQLLEWNSTVPAIGRTADNAWVKVVLSDGNPAWVAASAVSVAPEIGALPVTD